ncbi:HYR domain-containing protein [Mesonia mobilis]|uniref:HYR domain-containing protein n=1 Tax=Mesonia mobilis TaxID=369791 RepID=UPI0026F197E7|nr:HYR domain-containing protein [Mesonia mobilis]
MKKNYSKRSGIACYKKVYWLATIFMLFVSIANAQFTGPYDLSNWTLTNNNPGSDASVNLSGAPNSFIFTGSDSGSGGCCDLYDDFEITVTSTTSINFDYNFSNPDIEQFYYVINGTATHVTFSGSGSLSVPVTAGDTFAFRVYNGDNCCGAGVLTISNFSTGSCSMTASITSQTNVSCNGGSNGSLTVTPSSGTAPYIYSWNDTSSQTTATATNLTAGIYEVTITDDNGCTATVSATITQPSSALSANGVATDVSCNGGNNGTVDLTVVGGTAPYSYAWSNGATTEDLSGLTAGTYNVTVTDANGCTATESVEVQQSAVLSVSGVSTDVSCNGLNNGAIDLTVVGGTPPYTYIWSNTATTEDLSGLEANTYSVTVTDANGCTATESIDIEVNDILAPVPVCQDITVQLDANGEVTISASDIDNGSYDQSIWLNYGDSTTFYSLDTNNQGFGNYVGFVGSTEEQVYFASVNAIDNKVRIGDELKIKYKGSNTSFVDRNIYWRGTGNAETDVTWEFSNSRDVFVLEQAGKTNGDLFDPKMPYTIKSTFLINGVEKYLSILGSDVTFTDDNSLKTYYTIEVVSGSLNECSTLSYEIDNSTFDCSMLGANTVTLTVTDTSGNSDSCTATVTVEDNTNPIANCVSPFTIALDATGNASITAADINNGSTDNCGIDTTAIDITDFDCTMIGANQVELTVTDASGNSSTCTTTVTVVDETNPTANCVAPFTISLDANGNAQISESDINDGSTDNCGVDSVSIDVTDFDCTMVGENDVTLTVTDASGNSSTCTTTVTVEDSESPIAMCQDITVSLDDTGNASITAPDIDNGSTDNCAIDSYEIDVDSFDCTMTGMNMVTLTITDTNGNSSTCTSTVTVEDNELPSISCEAITVSLDETGNISILPEDLLTDTFDNCGIENLSLDIDTFDCEDVGTDVEVTIFAQDASGNMTSCTTTVTVIDDLDPVFTCLADQTVIGNVEESYYIVPDFVANGEVSAVDNCDGEMITISQNPPAGSLLEEGEYDFTFVTTDQNGNTAVCISTITVETGDLSVKTPEVSLKSVDLYPNPAENFIIIDNPQHLELKEMVIYDLNGRKVLTLDLENYTDNTQLNISKLEAAQYFAMIKSTNNGVVVKRILRK